MLKLKSPESLISVSLPATHLAFAVVWFVCLVYVLNLCLVCTMCSCFSWKIVILTHLRHDNDSLLL